LIGTACNDNNPCTINDVYTASCGCAGTATADADNDGVCAAQDPNDNNACIPNANHPNCSPCVVATSESFETGYVNFLDGGVDCNRSTSNPSNGTISVQLRDNSGAASGTASINLNLVGSLSAKVSFSWIGSGMESGEDFFLEISTNGGSTYTILKTYVYGTTYVNGTRYNENYTVTGITFTANTRFRLRCDASDDSDQIFIDNIIISKCTTAANAPLTERTLTDDRAFTISPNPSMGDLVVDLTAYRGDDVTLRVFDIKGQQVHTSAFGTVTQDQTTLDLSSLVDGMYFVQLSTQRGFTESQKLVIQKN
jgi:hypothetical protein